MPPPLLPPPPAFALIAHRGDSDGAPENTLAAFDLALANGFAAFETDAQLSADGAPVLIHCETLERTTSGAGRVADATLAQLAALDAGSWFSLAHAGLRVPTLEEALRRYKGRAHIHLELKSQQPGLPAAVAAAVREHGWDYPAGVAPEAAALGGSDGGSRGGEGGGGAEDGAAVGAAGGLEASAAAALGSAPGLTITSFHLQQLRRSKELLPAVHHAWLIQEWGPGIAAEAKAAAVEVVCPRANALTREAVREMKGEGFAVRAWGVKTTDLLLHVVACGADGATVNWPLKAAAALRGALDGGL